MPTYAYRCTACGHEFDTVQKFSDAPITECPVCGSDVRRVFQSVGVVFKGSGWYINDSRGAKAGSAAAAANKSDTSSDKSSNESATKESGTPAAASSESASTSAKTAGPAKTAAD